MSEDPVKTVERTIKVIDGPIIGAGLQALINVIVDSLPLDFSLGGRVDPTTVKELGKTGFAMILLVNDGMLPDLMKGAGVGATILQAGGLIVKIVEYFTSWIGMMKKATNGNGTTTAIITTNGGVAGTGKTEAEQANALAPDF